jgi:hypothetical protein
MSPINNVQTLEPSNWTRFWGGLKTLGGAAETVAGGAFAISTSWTGIGGVAGGGVAAHGIDTSIAGVKQLISGFEERSYTAKAIENITGSQSVGDIADTGIGLAGSFGTAFAKVASGFSKVRVPAGWVSKVWRFGELPPGVLGSTDPVGNIIIQNGLKGKDFQRVLDHESVHRFFSPAKNIFQKIRAQIGASGYNNSQLLRFSEEAIAETYASGSLKEGVLHPLVNGYGITVKGLATESSVLGGVLEKSNELGEKIAE